MEITEVKVRLWDDKRLRALVTIVFENCFVVRNIKVIEGRDERLFVAMPSRRLSNGTYSDLAHPITREFRHQMESIILSAYLEERELAEKDPEYAKRVGPRERDEPEDSPTPHEPRPEPRRWFMKR
jgi:stage V sporulation protein G